MWLRVNVFTLIDSSYVEFLLKKKQKSPCRKYRLQPDCSLSMRNVRNQERKRQGGLKVFVKKI